MGYFFASHSIFYASLRTDDAINIFLWWRAIMFYNRANMLALISFSSLEIKNHFCLNSNFGFIIQIKLTQLKIISLHYRAFILKNVTMFVTAQFGHFPFRMIYNFSEIRIIEYVMLWLSSEEIFSYTPFSSFTRINFIILVIGRIFIWPVICIFF